MPCASNSKITNTRKKLGRKSCKRLDVLNRITEDITNRFHVTLWFSQNSINWNHDAAKKGNTDF